MRYLLPGNYLYLVRLFVQVTKTKRYTYERSVETLGGHHTNQNRQICDRLVSCNLTLAADGSLGNAFIIDRL